MRTIDEAQFPCVSCNLYHKADGVQGFGSGEEIGGFLQVSNLTYRVDGVQVYNKEAQSYATLELNASYNLAGYNYTLRDLGDGFAMFDGALNVLDYVMEDYMVLANYVLGFENGVVDAENSPLLEKYPGMLLDYSGVNGRIETR